jgi:hypothetical protein
MIRLPLLAIVVFAAEYCRIEAVFAHEIGHALGFWHVGRVGSVMYPSEVSRLSGADAPTDIERHHAALAYGRPAGNLDIDRDPQRRTLSLSSIVIH